MAQLAISMGDITAHPNYKKDVPLKTMLCRMGMDVAKGFELDMRHLQTSEGKKDVDEFDFYHRTTFTGEVVKCERYVGHTRSDGKWTRFFSDLFDIGYR